MRIDLPHDLPRHRPEPPSASPLPASPIEQRQEHLAARAAERRAPLGPHPAQHRSLRPERPRESRERAPSLDRHGERRVKRDRLPQRAIGLSLREEERMVLADTGRFRVIATRDLVKAVYRGNKGQMQQDLRYLREHGLIELDMVRARRDGGGGHSKPIEVVTLTKDGRSLARYAGGVPESQKLYYGIVKPREVEHDAQIYSAYQKEAAQIEKDGGSNLRVQLDFELKSQVQKAIYRERKSHPERDMAQIKQQAAEQFHLPFVNGKIQIPDARIEYDQDAGIGEDMDQGSRTGYQDIEVLTAAYRRSHLQSKAQAGFHVYASSSDRATLTAKIEDDRHLMENILEL